MCVLEVQLLGTCSLFSYFFWDNNCRVLYVPTSLLHVEERAKEASVLVSLQRHLGLMVVQRANSLGAQCRLQASIDLCQPPCGKEERKILAYLPKGGFLLLARQPQDSWLCRSLRNAVSGATGCLPPRRGAVPVPWERGSWGHRAMQDGTGVGLE